MNKGCQGYGIKLLKHPKDLRLKKVGDNDDMVIQKYIEDPLLIDNKKHDLRLYLIVISLDPLIAYLNEEGLARFCTQDYERPTKDNIDNLSIHLTNYSQNKTNKEYVFSNELTEDNDGSKRTLTSYWKSIERHGHDSNLVSFHPVSMFGSRWLSPENGLR